MKTKQTILVNGVTLQKLSDGDWRATKHSRSGVARYFATDADKAARLARSFVPKIRTFKESH